MLVFLLACIEIPVLLIAVFITNVVRPAVKSRSAQKANANPSRSQSKMDLSADQKEKIVKAILEDSLLENDSVYDSLMNEGEAQYPAAAACKCDAKEFDLQYGSKSWINAWVNTLTMWFDCQASYTGNGSFRVYGKEA